MSTNDNDTEAIAAESSLHVPAVVEDMNNGTRTHTNSRSGALIVRCGFTVLGIGFLLPWNAFISASAYFENRIHTCGTGNGNGTASFSNAASSSAPSASRANARRSGDSGHTEFMQNDLVLITCDSSIVEQAYKGILRPPDKSSYSMSSLLSLNSPFVDGRLAIMGTVTQRCKSLDALVVQVSRRLWKPTSMGASDLFLLRLGSNITGEWRMTIHTLGILS